jgi:FkbM family methyltransferase
MASILFDVSPDTSRMNLFRKLKTFSKIVSGCSNWREIALLKLGVSTKPVNEVRLRNGMTIEVDRDLRKIWGEVFEPAIADVYDTVASDADLFIDVGANIGSFSCLAAYTHPSARVYSFEPDQTVASQAERNFKRNNLKNVTLIRKPVTSDGREVRFARFDNRGASNIYQPSPANEEAMASTTLDCVDFSGSKSLFVKLDCEGAEGEIIDWLISHRPQLPPVVHVSCEYHPWCPIPQSEATRRLREAGFRAVKTRLFAADLLLAESVRA